MHLFIIISSIVVAIGLAVGLVFEFVANGYFNYGAEFKSYNTVEINYAYVEFSDKEDVIDICDGVFDKAGVSYFACTGGDTDEGGRVVFKFAKKYDSEKLAPVIVDINSGLKDGIKLNHSNFDLDNMQTNAAFHSLETQLNGKKVLTLASIAVASAIVLQFLYYVVRYKLTMAFAACLANVHNLAIYVSLLAITRVPVGISAVALGGLTVLATMIACGYVFDRYRRNLKNEKYEKLTGDEITDLSVNESLKSVLYPVVGIATAAVVICVLLSISAMSAITILAPVAAAVFSAASAIYGTVFFVPPVYTRIKRIGDNAKARSKNKK